MEEKRGPLVQVLADQNTLSSHKANQPNGLELAITPWFYCSQIMFQFLGNPRDGTDRVSEVRPPDVPSMYLFSFANGFVYNKELSIYLIVVKN